MSKILKTTLLVLLVSLFITNFSLATDIDMNLTSTNENTTSTNTSNSIASTTNNISNTNTNNNNTNTTRNNSVSSSVGESTVISSMDQSSTDDGLGLSNILNILLIVVGIVLILLGIAILIRLHS